MLCHLGSGEGEDRQIGFKVSFKNNFVDMQGLKLQAVNIVISGNIEKP